MEEKTEKGIKRKVKDDHLHYLDTLRYFKSYVSEQNLISSTSHTVRTVHTRKVGLAAFDTKRWLCEDTVHTHSHGHKDTVPDPMYLVNRSFIIRCIVDAGVMICLGHHCDQSGWSLILILILNLILILILRAHNVMDSHKTVFVVHLLICKLFM